MHPRLRVAAMLVAGPMLALSLATLPSHDEPGCVRPTPGTSYNQSLFRSLMRRKDKVAARFLAAYNVPRVRMVDVRPVSDPVVCRRAAVAYGRVLRHDDPDRKVHILRVGNRYVVMDPEYVVDNRHRAVTFDSTLTRPIALVAE